MSVLASAVVQGARVKRGDKTYEVDHVNGEGHGAIIFARRLGVWRATPRPFMSFPDSAPDSEYAMVYMRTFVAEWSADDTGALKT
jgi:hypothetical protein